MTHTHSHSETFFLLTALTSIKLLHNLMTIQLYLIGVVQISRNQPRRRVFVQMITVGYAGGGGGGGGGGEGVVGC